MGWKLRYLLLFLLGLVQVCLALNQASAQCNPTSPSASFLLSTDTLVCSGTSVSFYSTSAAYKGTISWDFGDMTSSSDTASGDTVSFTFRNSTVPSKLFHV
ncbi:MAG: hypothetical protein LPK45_05175, partial [Bacteroidota bacterium]|nr:hypothetical protein [Bacteroidota bacterium]MDX5430452.1 hypothetical protein [Bacteroidota bacterium]MDX5469211.1 hypothetical protein [Bacteroidota bacterium]